MAAMNKTQRRELVEILEKKYQRKTAQIHTEERERAEKDSAALDKKARTAGKKIEKIIDAEIAALPDNVREHVRGSVSGGVHVYSLARTYADKRIEEEFGGLREKLDDLPERLFLASVQGDDIAKIMAEFAALN